MANISIPNELLGTICEMVLEEHPSPLQALQNFRITSRMFHEIAQRALTKNCLAWLPQI